MKTALDEQDKDWPQSQGAGHLPSTFLISHQGFLKFLSEICYLCD